MDYIVRFIGGPHDGEIDYSNFDPKNTNLSAGFGAMFISMHERENLKIGSQAQGLGKLPNSPYPSSGETLAAHKYEVVDLQEGLPTIITVAYLGPSIEG